MFVKTRYLIICIRNNFGVKNQTEHIYTGTCKGHEDICTCKHDFQAFYF